MIDLKKFKQAFRQKYSYVELTLSDNDIKKFLNSKHIKGLSIERQLDLFYDYVLSQGLADVQENKINKLRKYIKEEIKNLLQENDDEIIVIYFGKYPWYLRKSDSTHFYMSNTKDYKGFAYHIAQHKSEPYYEDIRSWLKGGKSPNGKKYADFE